ncbi:MAG: dihydroorotate dehydrogenase-like protein [Marinilabiliaceae bacterium]|jgi:dihydroorotate dehydrogenase (fumarate)|nr:dihydroorotate dehydrogenase-like protein [Marinilabiliaceae bacterium]
MADLTCKYLGLSLRNPIIAGSSGLTDSVDNIIELEKAGAGAVVLKSLFEEQIIMEAEASIKKAYENDFIYSAKSESLDYLDLHIKEDTISNYIKLIKEAKQKTLIPVIASVNCVSDVEWTSFAKKVQDAGADALELNIAVLPVNAEMSREAIEEIYFSIIKKVLGTITIPLAIKISPYFTNLAGMIKSLSATGIKGLVLFNRFYSPDFDINTFTEKSANTLSTPAESSNVLRWIALMSGKTECDLCATTGIHNGEALIKQILAGAAAVQVVSSLYSGGLKTIQEMVSVLENWMDEKGFNYVHQFKGKMSQDKSANPAAFERIQFMKYFSEIR